MYENIYVGDRLISVLEGEHYGEVVRDAMSGDIILIEDDRIVALGCTADSSSNIMEYWEKRINSKIRFRLSRDLFKNTGLNKAVVLPPGEKRKLEESPIRISIEEEMYYLKRDLQKSNKIIDSLKYELDEKEKKIHVMLESLRSINRQTFKF